MMMPWWMRGAGASAGLIASDTFPGSTVNRDRWVNTNADGASAVGGNILQLSLPAASGETIQTEANLGVAIGEFNAEVTVDWTGLDVALSSGQYVQFWLRCDIGGNFFIPTLGKWPPGHPTSNPGAGTGYDFQNTLAPPTSNAGANIPVTTDTLRVTRSAAGLLQGFVEGNMITWGTLAGDASISLWLISFGSGTKPATSVNLSNFIFEVDASTPIYI